MTVSDESRIAALPCWDGTPKIAPLIGGLSNVAFTVIDRRGKYVARVGRDYPFHHVFRDRELMVARAAFAAGLAPEIIYDEPGLTVARFIEGEVFGESQVRANIGPVANLIRRFHLEMPKRVSGPGFIFWVFHVIRDYAVTLTDCKNPLAARLPELLTANARLEAAQAPLPIVFGHNDLLPANLIDDGKRLWLIDFEYAGFNTAMFDLGGLASNAGFTEEESEALLTEYLGASPGDDMRRTHSAMQCASLLRETLWGLVSEMFLAVPGADYDGYARQNLARFDAAFASFTQNWPTA